MFRNLLRLYTGVAVKLPGNLNPATPVCYGSLWLLYPSAGTSFDLHAVSMYYQNTKHYTRDNILIAIGIQYTGIYINECPSDNLSKSKATIFAALYK